MCDEVLLPLQGVFIPKADEGLFCLKTVPKSTTVNQNKGAFLSPQINDFNNNNGTVFIYCFFIYQKISNTEKPVNFSINPIFTRNHGRA